MQALLYAWKSWHENSQANFCGICRIHDTRIIKLMSPCDHWLYSSTLNLKPSQFIQIAFPENSIFWFHEKIVFSKWNCNLASNLRLFRFLCCIWPHYRLIYSKTVCWLISTISVELMFYLCVIYMLCYSHSLRWIKMFTWAETICCVISTPSAELRCLPGQKLHKPLLFKLNAC